MVRETEISTQFGFKIYELIPMKGVYLIKTDKGNKCLKKINYGIQKLMYLYKVKDYLINNGYDRVDKYCLTPSGTPYAAVNDDIYIVTEWIEGRESDFKNPNELKLVSDNLANFHNCARNFIPDDNFKVRDDIGKLPSTIEKRLTTLNKMADIARKNKKKTEFDNMYLANTGFYANLAKESLRHLDLEAYYSVCEDSIKGNVLCHHDYTYHNILIDKMENAHLLDFDYCKSEIQIYDVATLIIKALKRLNWDEEYCKLIIDAYNGVKQISDKEYNVLKSLLIFPQRFWRLANRYYYKEAGWNEGTFNKKMKEIIDEKDRYLEFITKIDDILK